MTARVAAVVLVTAIVAGVGLATAIAPALFRASDHDLARIGLVLDDLRDPPPELRGVVFGSSVTMCGIDARRLGDALPGGPLFHNLSSTGQTLLEASLLQQHVPPDVTDVVVLALTIELEDEAAVQLDANVRNALTMYGHVPDDRSAATLHELDVTPLSRGPIRDRFESRWALRQTVDAELRAFVRRDLALDDTFLDLFAPSPYTERIAPAKFVRQLDEWHARRPAAAGPFAASANQVRVLRALGSRATAAGHRLTLVLAPDHPERRRVLGTAYYEAVRAWVAEHGIDGVTIVDATHRLDDTEFVDPVHPSPAGARALTAFVAAAVSEGR